MTDIQTQTRPAAQSLASLRQYVPKRVAEPTEALDGPPKKPAKGQKKSIFAGFKLCLLYTSPSPRDRQKSRMPSSA